MSSKFTCRFCKEQFDVPKGLYKHLQSVHTAGPSRDNRTCPICGVLCLKYEGYRDHLLYIHGQTDEGLKLTFKSLNEFLVWKTELELKHNCKYVLQSSPKVLPSKEKKYFYQCDRSDPKDKKDKKSISVVMKTCSSVISVVEGTNVFKVEYWDTHSGHSETLSAQSLQNELEAAISSVEMVNAIADSDDSCDRSEDMLVSETPSPSTSNVGKQAFTVKKNSPSKVNNINKSIKKSNDPKSSVKVDGSKKKNPSTGVFSLASVACGKGIKRKLSSTTDEKDSASKLSSENSKSSTKQLIEKPVINHEPLKGDSVSLVSAIVAPPKKTSILPATITTTVSTTLSGSTKTVSSGLPVLAPKPTNSSAKSSTSFTTINSLINSNSAFPNQLVIVNPVGIDQSSLNSKQLATGQNILFSLGSPGQSIVPAVSQSFNVVSVGENTTAVKSAPITANSKDKKLDKTKITSSTVPKTASKSIVGSVTTTTSSTVTVKSGLNNAPVILSSLPIGSTFMSVNNSLIPIATPSGTFLPTSLPPNIVLTPIPGTSLSVANSTQKTTVTSANSKMPSTQTQVRFTPSSTVAVTVSSIVKEPLYSSSSVKQMSHIVASSTMPISSAAFKTYSKNQNKSIPTTISGRISPLKNVTKFMTSTPIKSNLLANERSNANQSLVATAVNKNMSFMNILGSNVPSSKGNSFISKSTVMATVTVSSVTSPKNRTSARKSISIVKTKPSKSSTSNISTTSTVSSPGNTKLVNSQLNLAPISSVTSEPMDIQDSGTLLIDESSGGVYMLEPLKNTDITTKHATLNISKIKVDRSVQTNEMSLSALKSKIQKKRAAAASEDSAVMLKVKCYQLEMQHLNILGECKRLKVELTKERLKNAELTGDKVPDVTEDGMAPDTSRNKASEIMKEIEESLTDKSEPNVYTLTKTAVLRNLYEDMEELCAENIELNKELENYRTHDKFYKSLKKKLYDEEF